MKIGEKIASGIDRVLIKLRRSKVIRNCTTEENYKKTRKLSQGHFGSAEGSGTELVFNHLSPDHKYFY